jgi:signal transduction histidine kinase
VLTPSSSGPARSAALLLIAAVTPLMLVALFGSYTAFSTQRAQLEARALSDARLLSDAVDRELAGEIDQAEGLAASPALDGPVDLATFREVARREKARHPTWLNVVLLDAEGRWLASARDIPTRRAVEPGSLAKVIATRRAVVGDLRRGEGGNWGIAVRAPVIREGRLTHVATVVARPDAFHALIAAMKPQRIWIITIVNQEGRVVARSQAEARFVGGMASPSALAARRRGPNGIYEGYTLDHVHTISAWWTSPQSGWSVHIGVPKGQFETPLHRLLVLLGVGFVFAAALAVAFILLLLRELRQRHAEAAAVEQATRMDALGRLTGGVAHDFNNLLMVIQGNIDILTLRAGDEARLKAPLAAMRAATERAAKLTRQLLIFARGGGSERSPVDVAEVVRELQLDLRQLAGAHVRVNVIAPEERAVAVLDRLQLEAALLNLCANARDAMAPGGGEIVVAVEVDAAQVRLSVRDTGPGFGTDVIARAFDPFFTTKPVGQGTGLGLTQVYGFARASGGRVQLQNAPGGGGVVLIGLPRSDALPTPADRPEAPRRDDAPRGRVLLVEDEAEVRATIAGFLSESGLSVSTASNAAEALAMLEAEPFAAVLSDVIMPGEMGGSALALAIRRRWPKLPVVLISGYSDQALEAQDQGITVLTKPIDLNAVVRQLRSLLAAS